MLNKIIFILKVFYESILLIFSIPIIIIKKVYGFLKSFKEDPDFYTMKGMVSIHGKEKGMQKYKEYLQRKNKKYNEGD
jgi:hypothetical protein